MSIQQAPKLALEKLNAPSEQVAIVQEYQQSTASKLKAERFAKNQEQKIAQVTPAATQAEKEKIETIFKGTPEFNRSIDRALERDGIKRKKPEASVQVDSKIDRVNSKVEQVGNIKFKKGLNDVQFSINPKLQPQEQILERDQFVNKILSENRGNPHNKERIGNNMYKIIFKNQIK